MGNESGKEGGLFETSEKGGYQEIKDDVSKMCKCNIKTRIIGWVSCFCIGWILSIITTVVFIMKRDYTMFAILFSIGQILNITG